VLVVLVLMVVVLLLLPLLLARHGFTQGGSIHAVHGPVEAKGAERNK